MKPTIFVDIESRYDNSPIALVLKAVSFGADPVEQLVQGDAEADIAITNSITRALRIIKETEQTSIVIAHLGKQQREKATAFASRYPDRVVAVPFVGSGEGEVDVVPFLLKLISDHS